MTLYSDLGGLSSLSFTSLEEGSDVPVVWDGRAHFDSLSRHFILTSDLVTFSLLGWSTLEMEGGPAMEGGLCTWDSMGGGGATCSPAISGMFLLEHSRLPHFFSSLHFLHFSPTLTDIGLSHQHGLI